VLRACCSALTPLDIGTSIDQDVEVTTFTTTEQDGVRVHIQSVETKAKSMATSKLSDSNNLVSFLGYSTLG